MSKKQLIGATAVALALAGSTILTSVLSTQNTLAEESTQENITIASEEVKLVDETVYVFTNTDGTTRKTISSDWAKNIAGTDVYSKITDEQTTPLDLRVSYFLDDKEVSASEIAGKSGKVTVRYTFTNTEKVSGYYVPYMVISGVVLNNDNFKNVEVINGRLVNDGNRTIVAGVVLPGLQEDLGITSSQFEIPSYFEFSADASNFKLDMAVSVATSEVFSELNTSGINAGVAEAESQLNTLNSAMTQLVDGSKELYQGLDTLYVKVNDELAPGVAKLAEGANTLQAGTKELSTKLSAGQETLAGYSVAINGGLDQIINGILGQVNPDVNIDNYATYRSAIAAAKPEIAGVVDSLLLFREKLQGYTAGVNEKVTEAAEGAVKLNAGATELASGLAVLNNSTATLTTGVGELKDGAAKLNTGLDTFNAEGVQKIISLYDGNIKGLVNRLNNIAEIAKNHSSARYIYRTDAVK